jgi:hypothetical protein
MQGSYDTVLTHSVSLNDDLDMMPSSRKAPVGRTLHWMSDMYLPYTYAKHTHIGPRQGPGGVAIYPARHLTARST